MASISRTVLFIFNLVPRFGGISGHVSKKLESVVLLINDSVVLEIIIDSFKVLISNDRLDEFFFVSKLSGSVRVKGFSGISDWSPLKL